MSTNQNDADKLLHSMKTVAHGAGQSWNGVVDLTPFKKSKAYPGDLYCLMGNSFNVELTEETRVKLAERIVTLYFIFAEKNNGPCVRLSQAFKVPAFLSTLSRFERDWLARLSDDTMVGPAFDSRGKLIKEAFAVWRKDYAPTLHRKPHLQVLPTLAR